MIRIRLGGQTLSTAQSQLVAIAGWESDTINTPGTLTIGLTAVQIFSGAVTFVSYDPLFRNISTGGQRIAIGFDNLVTIANAGLILEPGDYWEPVSSKQDFWAISSLAGGQLQRFSMAT